MSAFHTTRPRGGPARRAWDWFAAQRSVGIQEMYYSRRQHAWVCYYQRGREVESYQPEGCSDPSCRLRDASFFR